MSPRLVVVFLSALATAALAPSSAAAQMPTIDPGGSAPAEPAGGGDAPAGGGDRGGRAGGATPGAADGGGFFHDDEFGGDVDFEPTRAGGNAAVPDVHVVRRGDTLWDLCWFYFNNPWDWPKVWSFNPEITNPHWIYPGDQVRLRIGGAPLPVEGEPIAAGLDAGRARPSTTGFELRQIAFVDLDDLKFAARIDGSPEEKVMLSRGDEAYLTYPEGKPPKVGQRYSLYKKKRDVKQLDGDAVAGAYVSVIGELEVVSVKKGKRARAVITDSVDVVERGTLVGPLKQRFTDLEPTAAKADLQGSIIGVLGSDQLIGARQVVFLDKGKADGVIEGNRLYAVRRGDAYEVVLGPSSNIGKDDRRFPARALGELLVVESSKHTSLAVVTFAIQELGIGDHVVLSRAAN